jgi:hypothetical protein
MDNSIDTMWRRMRKGRLALDYFEPEYSIIRSSWDIWLDKQKSSRDEVIAKGALSIQRRLSGKRLKFSLPL